MHDLFDDAIYEDYANKWESYEKILEIPIRLYKESNSENIRLRGE